MRVQPHERDVSELDVVFLTVIDIHMQVDKWEGRRLGAYAIKTKLRICEYIGKHPGKHDSSTVYITFASLVG